MCRSAALRSLGRNLEVFEARTLLRVNVDFRNLLERGGSIQKSRPRRLSAKKVPEVPRTRPSSAGARSLARPLLSKAGRREAGSAARSRRGGLRVASRTRSPEAARLFLRLQAGAAPERARSPLAPISARRVCDGVRPPPPDGDKYIGDGCLEYRARPPRPGPACRCAFIYIASALVGQVPLSPRPARHPPQSPCGAARPSRSPGFSPSFLSLSPPQATPAALAVGCRVRSGAAPLFASAPCLLRAAGAGETAVPLPQDSFPTG